MERMIEAPVVAIVLLPLLLVELAVMRRRRAKPARVIAVLAFTAYLGLVAAVTLFPIPIYATANQAPLGAGINLIPFASIAETLSLAESPSWFVASSAAVYLGNAIMLAPEGFLLPALFPKLRSAGRTLAFVLATAVGIELLQLIIGLLTGYLYRVVDVDDVILNFAGGAVGYLVFRLVAASKGKR